MLLTVEDTRHQWVSLFTLARFQSHLTYLIKNVLNSTQERFEPAEATNGQILEKTLIKGTTVLHHLYWLLRCPLIL